MAKVFIQIRTRDQSSTISVDGFSRYYVDSWSHTSVKLDFDSPEPGVGVLPLCLQCKIMTQTISYICKQPTEYLNINSMGVT